MFETGPEKLSSRLTVFGFPCRISVITSFYIVGCFEFPFDCKQAWLLGKHVLPFIRV